MDLFLISQGCRLPNLRLSPFTDFKNQVPKGLPTDPAGPIRQGPCRITATVPLLFHPGRLALADSPLPYRFWLPNRFVC
ncbi:hypothetical protein Taro_001510 [Colocasia esculenta]|uniref:Uncharacterized protein n=1 Tax=Colocasia esculenta TaxID=4460 RepID=A0A843TJ92_COLES|nr:hypothetical protein [Colocasia esculenta]